MGPRPLLLTERDVTEEFPTLRIPKLRASSTLPVELACSLNGEYLFTVTAGGGTFEGPLCAFAGFGLPKARCVGPYGVLPIVASLYDVDQSRCCVFVGVAFVVDQCSIDERGRCFGVGGAGDPMIHGASSVNN